jgi:hypothetical protein
LNGGTFSNIGGGLNNVGIAVGTVIENLFLGSGYDILTANAAANLIETGGGSDTIFGVIDGGAGFNTVYIDLNLIEVTDGGVSGAVLTGSNAFGATNVESFVFNDQTPTLAERGVEIDHATLNRWVVKFSPLIAASAKARKKPTAVSWRMDETYIKVRGK